MYFELIKLLIENGVEIDSKDNKDQTPFHYACIYDQVQSFNALISAKCNKFARNYHDGILEPKGTLIRREH